VKPRRFEYIRAETQDDAIAYLHEFGDAASLLAGGQSLVPAMALRMAAPEVLIDISSVADLQTIDLADGVLHIGAGCRYTDVLQSDVVRQSAPMLTRAIPFIAHQAIRNRGTIGGSLAHADPASELPACMLALGAKVVLRSERGLRRILADDFFLGTYLTAKSDDELLVGVEIPAIRDHTRHQFHEISRRSGDYAISGAAFSIETSGQVVTDARLAYFAVSDRPVLANRTAAGLVGTPLTADAIAKASRMATEEITFYADLYTSVAAKKQITKTLTQRLLSQFSLQET